MKAELFDHEYDTKDRFNSYWHQIEEIRLLRPDSILEIGVGSGFLSRELRSKGMAITTLDIDESRKPDVTGSITELPFEDDTFDVVVCFQVLEHLEYEFFPVALREIKRVTRQNVVLSLPDLSRVYRFMIQLPKISEIKSLIPLPRLKPLRWQYNGEHYWNIGCEGYGLNRILKDITAEGFRVKKNYRVFEMPWHRFLVLEKR